MLRVKQMRMLVGMEVEVEADVQSSLARFPSNHLSLQRQRQHQRQLPLCLSPPKEKLSLRRRLPTHHPPKP